MPSKHLSVGSTIAGWTIQRRLGAGGNGVVWQCMHEDGRSGAIKVLKGDLLEPASNVQEREHKLRRIRRFLDEIRFLRERPSDPGIVPLLDHFLPEKPSRDNRPWLVMPLATPL